MRAEAEITTGGIGEGSVERKIFTQSVYYSITTYTYTFLQLIRGLVIARLLGPSLFGLRTAFFLGIDLERYTQLGTHDAMVREIPYYRGGGEEDMIRVIESTVFSYGIIISSLICFFSLIASQVMKMQGYETAYLDMAMFFGILVITGRILRFLRMKFVAEKKIALLSKLQILQGVVLTIGCILLVYFYSLRGFFMGLLVGDLVCIGYIITKREQLPRLGISIQVLKKLIKIGFPVLLLSLLLLLFESFDKIVIISLLSKEMIGYYGVALFASYIILIIPNAISQVLFPRYTERLGETKDKERIKNYLTEPALIIAFFIPFIIGFLYLVIPIPFNYFLMDFKPSIMVAKILTFGSYFIAISTIPLRICYALDKHVRLIFILIPAVLLNGLLNFTFVKLGWGINGVAAATCVGYFLFCTITLWYSFDQYDHSISEFMKFLCFLSIPFIYSLLILLVIDRQILLPMGGIARDISYSLIKSLIFAVLYAPLLLLIKNHGIFEIISEVIPGRLGKKRR